MRNVCVCVCDDEVEGLFWKEVMWMIGLDKTRNR